MVSKDISVREKIVQTATRLFIDQGYNLTGINQIIEEAEIAKASLYYHFQSKEDLCVEYLKRRNEQWFHLLEEYLSNVSDPKQRIIKTFEFRAKHVERNNFSGCAYLRIISELPQRSEKIDHQVTGQKEKQQRFFLDLVKKVKGLSKERKLLLGEMLFMLFDGATGQCQIFKNTTPLQKAKRTAARLLAAKTF
jgi:AcrR family transcriptional regulator